MTDTPVAPAADAAEAPPKDKLTLLGERLAQHLAGGVDRFEIVCGELILHVKRAGLLAVMGYLRDDDACQFKQLIDICGVDHPERAERFDVVYQLLSLRHNLRVRVKITTDEQTPVSSVSALFSTAPWFERETWDLFGIMFDGLQDHRRILTDYGFDGHPLRKDFPLTGHVEVHYDPDQRRVVYGPVKLTQDFRAFDNLSPWEALTDVQQLAGDEKANYKPKIGWNPVSKAME